MIVLKLSKKEMLLLSDLLSKNSDLESRILSRFILLGDSYNADLTRDMTEEVRDYLTETLSKSGFGDNYKITPLGCGIEELIDRFYIEKP